MDLQAMAKTVARPRRRFSITIQLLVEHSRRSPEYATGLSPRAALALLHASRAWALIEGRDRSSRRRAGGAPGVAGHRLRPVQRRGSRLEPRQGERPDLGRADP